MRLRLVASAYAPMMLMFAVRLVSDHPGLALLLAVLSLASIGSVLLLVKARSALATDPFRLTSVKDETAQVPTFLLSYLAPFIMAEVKGVSDVIVMAIFLALVVIVGIGTNLVLVNPFLLLLGLHLYDVETAGGTRALLLSHLEPRAGDKVQALAFPAGGMKLVALERQGHGN